MERAILWILFIAAALLNLTSDDDWKLKHATKSLHRLSDNRLCGDTTRHLEGEISQSPCRGSKGTAVGIDYGKLDYLYYLLAVDSLDSSAKCERLPRNWFGLGAPHDGLRV